jgi:hypothetical protein
VTAQVILIGSAVISTLCAVVAILMSRGRLTLDKETLEKLRREQAEQDSARNRERVVADEKRVAVLHQEIDALTRTSNDRFKNWQEAIRDLDELWQFIEDHMPWDREAYRELRALGSKINPPPTIGRRRHYDGDGAPHA